MTAIGETNAMRLIVLGHMDPNDERFWSGIPKNIVRGLRDAGHEVITIGPLNEGLALWNRIKGRFYRHVLGQVYLPNRNPKAIRARTRQANRILRKHAKIDAVIVPYLPDAAYLRCEAPLILIHDATWHQLLDFYPGYGRGQIAKETETGGSVLDRCAIANCDRIVYSSQWAANSSIADYGISAAKIRVFPFGGSAGAMASLDKVKDWIRERGHAPCRLLFVALDWNRKGGDIAIAIAQALHDQGIAVELQVVGCSPPTNAPSFVSALGFLSQSEPGSAKQLSELFQKADFFLLPTRADCSPLVLCEAAAYGLPVVTTDVGGIPEIVQSDSWGLSLPTTTSPQNFAKWLREKYNDRESYRKMALLARQDYENRLNWSAFCKSLVATINEVLGDSSGATATTAESYPRR